MASRKPHREEWISARETARRLGFSHQRMKRVAEVSDIRRRIIPGRFALHHAGGGVTLRASSVVRPNPTGRRKAATE